MKVEAGNSSIITQIKKDFTPSKPLDGARGYN